MSTILQYAAGVTTVLSLLSFLGGSYVWLQSQQKERSVTDTIKGEGIVDARAVIAILKQFKSDEARLAALQQVLGVSRDIAANVLKKVKPNIDVGKFSLNNQIQLSRRLLITGLVLIILAGLSVVGAKFTVKSASTEEPAAGHCSTSCDRCVERNGEYACSSCTSRASDSLRPGVDYFEIPERGAGLRFSCYPLDPGRYEVRAQGTISTTFTTVFNAKSFYVGQDIGNGQHVQWWVTAGYKLDGDDKFYKGYEQTQSEQRAIQAAWGELTVRAPSSRIISGAIYVDRNQISPSVHGPLAIERDFAVTISPD